MEYFLNILTILCYFFAAVQCWYRSVNENARITLGAIFAFIAIALHAGLLHGLIDTYAGQNLSAINLLSQAIWFTACLAWLLSWSRWFSPLSLAVYVLAGVSMTVLFFSPGESTPMVYTNAIIIHVLLSLIVVSLYLLSGLQAILIVLQHHMIKNNAKNCLHYEWASIEKMETYLFQLIGAGFISLTALAGYSFLMLPAEVWLQSLTKLGFVLSAWIASGGLLLGRYFLGWRGSIAVKWTWFGLILLFAAFLLASIK